MGSVVRPGPSSGLIPPRIPGRASMASLGSMITGSPERKRGMADANGMSVMFRGAEKKTHVGG